MDLLEHIADQVGFNYVIDLIPDNNYGALDLSTGQWNGLVKGKRNKMSFIRGTFATVVSQFKTSNITKQSPCP